MRERYRTRRGVTLAELCVVMALLSILSATVVSFCVATNKYVGRLSADRDAKESLTFVNLALDAWVSAFDSDAYVITATEDGAELQARPVNETEPVYRLYLDLDGEAAAVVGELPDEEAPLRLEVSHLKALSFRVRLKGNPENDSRVLIFCTVTHDKSFAADGATDTTVLVRSTRSMREMKGGTP